ncbi:hypothetical protein MASR1M65_21100 [Saprospiraceae bacterium]
MAVSFDVSLPIHECHLQVEPSNAIRNALRDIGEEQNLEFYDAKNHTGFLRNVVIRITTTGNIMVIVAFGKDDQKKVRNYLSEVKRQFPEITSLYYCINTKLNDYYADLDMVLWAKGGTAITEMLGNAEIEHCPKSFSKLPFHQAKQMFDIVKEYCGLTGRENVYDLYTGLGSIALYIADSCRQITGIEEIAAAIDDAKINAALNNITNATFYAGDVKDILDDSFSQKHGKPDVVIDRFAQSGCMHADVVSTLLKLEAPKIVYVSCNPATQARDIQLLSEKYRVTRVKPVDMFPQTYHIESVALLELVK